MSGSLNYNIYTCCRWLQRCTCQSVTFLSHGLSSPPTPESYRAPLHNLSCTVFAHTAFSASLLRPLRSRQANSPLHKPVSRCRGLLQRSGDSQVAVPIRIFIYLETRLRGQNWTTDCYWRCSCTSLPLQSERLQLHLLCACSCNKHTL